MGLFHLKQLFSNAIMTRLDRESGCHEANEHIDCPQSAKYRRSDGRCSNLKFPQAGGAGRPYVRLLKAVRIFSPVSYYYYYKTI